MSGSRKLKHRLKAYKTMVVPALLNACETWTVYRYVETTKTVQNSSGKTLMDPDKETLKKAGMKLRYTGHVIRMSD